MKCSKCLRWYIMSNMKLSSTTPQKDYPEELLPANNLLPPHKISWNKLKQAVKLTTNNLVIGKWNNSNAKSYLSSHCINHNGYNHIITHSENIKALKQCNTSTENDTNVNYIKTAARNNASDFEEWKGGAFWNGDINIDAFVDVIMHLLFLGVVKSYREIMIDILKKEKVGW